MSAVSKKDREQMAKVIAENRKKEFTAKLPILLLEAIADFETALSQVGLSTSFAYKIEKDKNKFVCFDYRYDSYQSDRDQFVDSWFEFGTPKPLADIEEYQFDVFLSYIESLRQIVKIRKDKELFRANALAKLTKEERAALGLK